MSKLSPTTLKARQWHGFEPGETGPRGRGLAIAHIVVPLVVVALFLVLRLYVMAAVVGVISLAIVLTRQFSPVGRKRIDRGLAVFAHWVGQAVGLLVLGPVFFIGLTWVRLMRRLTGADPLRLRCGDSPTFWLPCDTERRRAKYAKSMFCSERLLQGRMQILPLLLFLLVLLLGAEIGLRIYGLRDAMVYKPDYDIGYYPTPNQRVRHPGRVITTNNHSMRSPDIAEKKAPGAFRILMLGDSTLAGTRVGNHELYSTLLENKLNEVAGVGTRKFEVMNMGVNAWGPLHEYAFVKKFGSFEADLAIICGPVYNCYRPLYGLESLPFFPDGHPPRLALEHVAYQLVWQYRHEVMGPAPWNFGDAAVAQVQAGVEAWGAMSELLQKNGAEVMVQFLPRANTTMGLPSVMHWETEDPGQGLFEKVKARVGDKVYANLAGPIFKDAMPREQLYHDGVHFERLGHRLYAAYLFEQLREHSPRVKTALQRP